MKKTVLNIGDIVVSREPSILETVLGSCVSVCLWDEGLRIGGMNHFMLPLAGSAVRVPELCGAESTSRLIKTLLRTGADIHRLRAKVFGGGRVIREFNQSLDVGRENIRVAKEVLKQYGIPVIRECTGKDFGIKVVFYTATGNAFAKTLKEVQ